jgi:Methylamine utilisation protein MauE
MKSTARVLQLALSIVLALVWIQSTTAHAENPYLFLSSIYKYKIVNPAFGQSLAIVLPGLQFVLAICLLSRIFVGGALLGSALLLTLFAGVQASALARGLKIDCGCFGSGGSEVIGRGSIGTVGLLCAGAYIALACFIYSSPERARDGR